MTTFYRFVDKNGNYVATFVYVPHDQKQNIATGNDPQPGIALDNGIRTNDAKVSNLIVTDNDAAGYHDYLSKCDVMVARFAADKNRVTLCLHITNRIMQYITNLAKKYLPDLNIEEFYMGQ